MKVTALQICVVLLLASLAISSVTVVYVAKLSGDIISIQETLNTLVAAPPEEVEVQIMAVIWASGIWFKIAEDLGLPEKVEAQIPGLTVTIKYFSDFDLCTTAVLYTPNAIGYTGSLESMAAARAAGSDVQIAGPSIIAPAYVVVLNDSPIQTFGDLKGKNVGVYEMPTYYDPVLIGEAEKYGMKWPDDLASVKPGPQPGLVELLDKGELDAAFITSGPFYKAIATGKYRPILKVNSWYKENTGYDLLAVGINIHENFAKKYPDIVKAVFTIRDEAVNWSRTHEAEAIDKIATTLGVSAELKEGLKFDGGIIEKFGPLEWNPGWAYQMFKYVDEDLREVGIIDVPVTMDLFTTEYYP